MSQVAYAVPLLGCFTGQIENPVTDALCNTQEPFVPRDFESLDVCMANQCCPHNYRIVFCISASARNKIKMITPTMMLEPGYLVLIKPFQAINCFIEILLLFCDSIE